MARLYANENLPLQTIEALRAAGHDVLTSFESGKANQAIPDDEVLAFAVAQERILVTLNRKHFIRLHRQTPNHSGIIVCMVDADFKALAERIDEAIKAQPEMDKQLVRVNRPAM